jgi:hypothetical protein
LSIANLLRLPFYAIQGVNSELKTKTDVFGLSFPYLNPTTPNCTENQLPFQESRLTYK